MSIVYSSGVDRLTEHNSSFDRGVLRVCYVGANRNNSFISKETFEQCIQSIYNCPIVCRYDRELDEIGAHDMDVVRNANGDLVLVNLTSPVGLIPESAKYWWEEIDEEDGTVHEYLCVEAILWKRQEAYLKIKNDGIVEESMEIHVKDGRMCDGVYHISDFEFLAFCLLGTAEPCYESAALVSFSKDDFKAEMDEMMQEFKESFSLVQSSQEVITQQQNNLEGGEKALDEKRDLMAKYGLSEEMLDFNLDDFSVEELTEKFEAIKETDEQKAAEAFALASQVCNALNEALASVKVETCFGEMNKYWYTDHDDEAMEVYCYDNEDWKLYGFSYSMNGDVAVVDFDSKKRKKFAIVDFDEGEQPAVFSTVFAQAADRLAEVEKAWSEKYQAAEEKLATAEDELTTLRQYKADIEGEAAKQEREQLFAKFADLAGDEALEALREDCEKYSLDELEEKCYAIRGRKQTEKFSMSGQAGQKAPKLPVERTGLKDSEPYGGVFSEFGITE